MRARDESPPAGGTGVPELTVEDWLIINSVDQFLGDALLLKQWWQRADAAQNYADRFELERSFNRPDWSYGFFDSVPLSGMVVPIMGSVHSEPFPAQVFIQ